MQRIALPVFIENANAFIDPVSLVGFCGLKMYFEGEMGHMGPHNTQKAYCIAIQLAVKPPVHPVNILSWPVSSMLIILVYLSSFFSSSCGS